MTPCPSVCLSHSSTRRTIRRPTLFLDICVGTRALFSQSCPWVGLTHGLGWVGSGHTKWTHGKLCIQSVRVPIELRRSFGHESEFVLSKYC